MPMNFSPKGGTIVAPHVSAGSACDSSHESGEDGTSPKGGIRRIARFHSMGRFGVVPEGTRNQNAPCRPHSRAGLRLCRPAGWGSAHEAEREANGKGRFPSFRYKDRQDSRRCGSRWHCLYSWKFNDLSRRPPCPLVLPSRVSGTGFGNYCCPSLERALKSRTRHYRHFPARVIDANC
jgi:hypothetical protein